jgi:Phosphatidylinositol 3- and 4-kinase
MRDREAPSRSAGGRLWWPSLLTALLLVPVHTVRAQAPEPAPPPPAQAAPDVAAAPAVACSKIWLGHEADYEEMLRTASVTRIEELKIGVTRSHCAFVEPGLPFKRMAWKTLKPGMYQGFYESYRSEIAAYELDKLLGLGMVPPSVERRVKAQTGAAILWVENVKAFDRHAEIRAPDMRAWARQFARAKMFDQLVGNPDRNPGNLLYDAEYHVILIDHSRAFRELVDLNQYQRFLFVDQELWERMQALTLETMQPTLGKWVSKGMLYAVLDRRNRMKKEIDKLVAARGPSIWLR